MTDSASPSDSSGHTGLGLGLALSGGGFRAMLFHLGSVWRLDELGLLQTLERISSVSGGSLLNGRLAARWSTLQFRDGGAANFRSEIAEPVLRFAARTIDGPAIAFGLLPRVSSGLLA